MEAAEAEAARHDTAEAYLRLGAAESWLQRWRRVVLGDRRPPTDMRVPRPLGQLLRISPGSAERGRSSRKIRPHRVTPR